MYMYRIRTCYAFECPTLLIHLQPALSRPPAGMVTFLGGELSHLSCRRGRDGYKQELLLSELMSMSQPMRMQMRSYGWKSCPGLCHVGPLKEEEVEESLLDRSAGVHIASASAVSCNSMALQHHPNSASILAVASVLVLVTLLVVVGLALAAVVSDS